MADNMPRIVPPRTPSPVSDDERQRFGLGIEGASGGSRTGSAKLTFDRASLSPPDERDTSMSSSENMLSPDFTFSPVSVVGSLQSPLTPQMTPQTPARELHNYDPDDVDANNNPFNFETQQYTAGRGSAAREIGKRRGHKYKHSSISHQIFQEPAPRAPLQLPASLPMPTRTEVQRSITSEQRVRLLWCFCHFLVAGYVQWVAHGSLAMTALSRLLLFDAFGAVTVTGVDMMANFEVWKRSSIKHPFGLERVDVLAGFGLSVFISFMGLDVLSHGIEHSLEGLGSHESHSPHTHARVTAGSVDVAALVAIIATLVSAFLLKNNARIGKAMRVEFLAGWGKILGNPSHFMTLSCSTLLLLLPLLSIKTYAIFDTALSGIIAVIMIAFGARLGTSLASMLLMSYAGPGGESSVKNVVSEIEIDPNVSSVDEARFWQVHYGVGMANLKVRYRGSGYGDELARMRDRLASLVRNRLGGGYGVGGLKWEVNVQLALERD